MMNAQTGRMMSLTDHVHQSIKNILFTRMGTRLQREEYGSLLPELLDMPLNEITLLQCSAAVVMALAKWETRFVIESATAQAASYESGLRVQITLSGSLNGVAQNFVIGV